MFHLEANALHPIEGIRVAPVLTGPVGPVVSRMAAVREVILVPGISLILVHGGKLK